MSELTDNLAQRCLRQKLYDKKLKDVNCIANIGKQRGNEKTALTRYCLLVEDAETIAGQLRVSSVHSNTMYPMLVDRFYLFFNKKYYSSSFYLRNKILNLWTDVSCEKNMDLTAQILTSGLGKK